MPLPPPTSPWPWPRSARSLIAWGAGLSASCATVIVCSAMDVDETSIGILLIAPVGLLLALLCRQAIANNPDAMALVFFAAAFLLDVTFRTRDYTDKSVDGQVFIKIASWILIGIIALRNLPSWWPAALTPVHFFWSVFYGWLLLSSSWAHFPLFSFVSVSSLIVFHVFMLHLVVHFDEISIVKVVILTIAIVCVLSLVVYVVFPTMGRSIEFINNAKVLRWRMRGITGAPNALGAQAAFGLCLVGLYWRDLSRPRAVWPAVAAAACFACLILSQNRSALLALTPPLVAYYGLRPRNVPWTALALALAAVAIVAVAMLVPDPLSLLSRSGKESEITTATNRSAIWFRVIELWKDEPIAGYGYGSMLFYLPISPDLFQAASHAHNIVLECLVSSGLIGLALLLAALGATVIAAIRNRASRPTCLLSVILIKGLTESTPFSGVASFSALILSLCIALIAVASWRQPRGDRRIPRPVAVRIRPPLPHDRHEEPKPAVTAGILSATRSPSADPVE